VIVGFRDLEPKSIDAFEIIDPPRSPSTTRAISWLF
jgi:hypothetical protein